MEIDTKLWSTTMMSNRLLNKDGSMCVLGFLGKANGLDDSELFNKVELTSCFKELPESLEWLRMSASWGGHKFRTAENLLFYLNDNQEHSRETKKKNLKQFFQRVGIEIKYT